METEFSLTVDVEPVVDVFYAAPEAQAVEVAQVEIKQPETVKVVAVEANAEEFLDIGGGVYVDLNGLPYQEAMQAFTDWGGVAAVIESYHNMSGTGPIHMSGAGVWWMDSI